MLDEIRAIVESLIDKETFDAPLDSPWARGSTQQYPRMMKVARLCAERYSGDLCEIGLAVGSTTSGLAQIAREFNRRVIGIDPWIKGTANCSGVEYGLFLKHTKEWKDIIDVIRLKSEDPKAIRLVQERELCFAYVDGAHEVENLVQDLKTVSHAKVICVDDLWKDELLEVFNASPREKYYAKICHEGYLI